MAENKIPVTLYEVEANPSEFEDFDFVTNEVIKYARKKGFLFNPDKLAIKQIKDFKFKVYYHVRNREPQWRGFLSSILDEDAVLSKAKNKVHSFLCFISYKDYIFVLCGGIGSLVVRPFVSPDFGMRILVRLFKKHDRVVKSTQDRGVSGIVLGQQKFYRGDQRFSDENEFGKIYKKFQAQIKKSLLSEIFRFNPDEIKRKGSGCTAKDSFQLSKSIEFDKLIDVIKTYVDILEKNKDGNFTLNKVMPVTKRDPNHEKIIKELNSNLVKQLYEDCVNDRISDVDFCHSEFEDYRTADSYKLRVDKDIIIELEEPITLTVIIEELRNIDKLVIDDDINFRISILDLELRSYDEDGELLTLGSVFDHLHGELNFNNNTYFLIDGQWYRIHPEFIEELNQECLDVLEEAWMEDLLEKPFDLNKDESVFNLQFIDAANTYVFDTVVPDNIELCDIFRYNDNGIFLIHVKRGFNNSIRDLASQVAIAAKTLDADKKTGFQFLDRLQNMAEEAIFSDSLNKKKIGKQKFPIGGIKSVLQNKKGKKITFCLAFVDEATNNRSLKDNILDFRSNIAKYSIVGLYRQVNSLGFDLKIIQLKSLPKNLKKR